MTSAYLRARDADPKSSYGDFAAVSHPVDDDLAGLLSGIVCHGIIAPGYDPGTVGKLSKKKNGRFLIMEADPAFTPPPRETRARRSGDIEAACREHGITLVRTGPRLFHH